MTSHCGVYSVVGPKYSRLNTNLFVLNPRLENRKADTWITLGQTAERTD